MNKTDLIYVSGHTGLLGDAIIRTLEENGYTNLVVAKHSEVDLINQQAVSGFFARTKPQYVFHCAAKIGGITSTSQYHADYLYENLMIAVNVIKAAHGYNVKKMIIPGSVCTFPKDCPVPIKEEYACTGAFEPTCEGYAVAKMTAYMTVKHFNHQYGTEFLTSNLCNLYGLKDCWDISRNHVIPALIERFHKAKIHRDQKILIRGTGNAYREFLYADDAADGMLRLMLADTKGIDSVNLGLSSSTTTTITTTAIHQLVDLIKKIVGFEGSVVYEGKADQDGNSVRSFDGTRLNSIIDWKPKVGLEEGLKRVYECYQQAQT